jgi:hypothetical protein
LIEPSTLRAAKALAWSDLRFGGIGAPTDKGYTKIYSNLYAFAALKADGAPEPPNLESPHALIEPSTLRVAKACSVE